MVGNYIKPGDKVGVMAPSSFVEKEDIERSKAALEARGYSVFIHPQTYMRENQSAGSAKNKLNALHALYADKSIDAIWAAGGGNRALYLPSGLHYDLILENPKPIIGFSDITALLNPIYAHCNVSGFHAQNFKHLHDFEQLDETLSFLSGASYDMDLSGTDIIKEGTAKGAAIGGCLSLFHYLVGTPECPSLDGAILFLEDTGDEISRFDRMFAHMKRLGAFENIAGLVLGEFHDVRDSSRPFGFSLEDIVLEAVVGRNIPIIINAPFGHGKNLLPLRVGGECALNITTSDSLMHCS